jgi:hypothetical protein
MKFLVGDPCRSPPHQIYRIGKKEGAMRTMLKAGLLVLLFSLPAAAQWRDRDYGDRNRDRDRYSAYQAGREEGYRDGMRAGMHDARTGRRYDSKHMDFRGDRYGYGRAGDYKKGYKDGYRQGYDAGYRDRNRDRDRDRDRGRGRGWGRWF